MLLKLLRDRSGAYAIMTAILMVPLLGGLAIAIDYAEMSRERQAMLHALDAAGTATARRMTEGVTDDQARAYAYDFFKSNLNTAGLGAASLTVKLPENSKGIANLELCAHHEYSPYFYPAFVKLLTGEQSGKFPLSACSEIRLKNTIEVALVLDNSGSMDEKGKGSGKKRIDLLKEAAKQLADRLAAQGLAMKKIAEPVRMSLVPFAASVNVGAQNKGEPWMDVDGISPVHHENFDYSGKVPGSNREVKKVGSMWVKKGKDWGSQENKPFTRFSLFQDMRKRVAEDDDDDEVVLAPITAWAGCVEARPHPMNINDDPPSVSKPESLFVPMFAPDEFDPGKYGDSWRVASNWWWWDDHPGKSEPSTRKRQEQWFKYYIPWQDRTINFAGRNYFITRDFMGKDKGPNYSCSTSAITPLMDITNAAGLATIKTAIDEMQPLGATNVPEGMAWGWRTVSKGAPFTNGRPDNVRGNDKVIIVLTDGANTYYPPTSLGASDLVPNRSTYSAYGYVGTPTLGGGETRLFRGTGTDVKRTEYTMANYTKALNDHFKQLCDNAKAANVIVMTVALDLDEKDATEKGQIDALRNCASDSRTKAGASGKAEKLFWNATGGSLSETFKKIADELSNMRIVS